MIKEFWEWYDKQGFIWSKEDFWNLPQRDILIFGMMTKYLFDKGIDINTNSKHFKSFEEMFKWLQKGIEWA